MIIQDCILLICCLVSVAAIYGVRWQDSRKVNRLLEVEIHITASFDRIYWQIDRSMEQVRLFGEAMISMNTLVYWATKDPAQDVIDAWYEGNLEMGQS